MPTELMGTLKPTLTSKVPRTKIEMQASNSMNPLSKSVAWEVVRVTVVAPGWGNSGEI